MKHEGQKLFPMNLQFFAEPKDDQKDDPNDDPKDNKPDDGDGELTLEEKYQKLLEQNTQLSADNAKLKRDKDTASTDAATWKKKYNATLTDAQQAAQAKAEEEAKRKQMYDDLVKKDSIRDLSDMYIEKLHYPVDKAREAAKAQYEGDSDTLFRIQSEVQSGLIKQAEAEWYKNRPEVSTGAGGKADDDAFLKGFNKQR